MNNKEQAKRAGGILLTIILVILGLIIIGSLLQLFTSGAIWPWLSSNSETFRNYALIVGGGYGIYIAIRRADAHDEQAAASKEQTEVAINNQANEIYTKSVENLAQNSKTRALSGLYSLSNLAQNNPEKYIKIVINTLSAYIREKSSKDMLGISVNLSPSRFTKDDVRIALKETIRLIKYDSNNEYADYADLSGSYLPKFDFFNMNLFRFNLNKVNFSNSIFGPRLVLPSYISDSNFYKSFFQGSLLGSSFVKCSFEEARFNSMSLKHLYFIGCDFKGATFVDCWDIDEDNFTGCTNINISNEKQFIKSIDD